MRILFLFLSIILATNSFSQVRNSEDEGGASYNCSIATPPDRSDKDPGISITITINEEYWVSILHTTRSGQRYFRQEQYTIDSHSAFKWVGDNIKRNNIRMIGELKATGKNKFSYTEYLYDFNKSKVWISQINAECVAVMQKKAVLPPPKLPQLQAVAPVQTTHNICKPGTHQPIPVIFGVNYDEARKTLIAGGWQPMLAPPLKQSDYASNGNGPELWAAGFREVRSCAGSGMANCEFDYSDVYNNILSVFTTGEVSLQGEKKTWNIVSATSCRAQH